MADYPIPGSPDLSALDPLTPAGSETPAKIDDAIRQVKAVLQDFLEVSFNNDGTLKTGTLATASLADLSVTTAKLADLAVTVGKLANDAVETGKIKDSNVTTAKIADLAVTAAKIANATITVAKLANDAVETAIIKDLAVTTAKLNDLAVTTGKLADSSVSGAKIADAAIGVAKLASQTAATLLAGTGTGVAALTVGGVLTAQVSGGSLLFSLAGAGLAVGYAVVVEKSNSGTGVGGSAAAATWNARPGSGATTMLTELTDSANLVSIVGNYIRFAVAGSYLVRFQASAYSVGLHALRLKDVATSATLLQSDVCAAPVGAMNSVTGCGVLIINAANTDIAIEHWTELAQATNGLGLANGASTPWSQFFTIEILQLSVDE